MTATALLIGIGLVGGFSAGLLGLGGSVVLAPLLLIVPGALGHRPLPMHEVAAITLAYLVFSTGAVTLVGTRGPAERTASLRLGLVGAVAALGGGLLSARLADRTILLLFALSATLASLLLLAPGGDRLQVPGRWAGRLSAAVAAGTGALTGLVGAAGGFLLEPLIVHLGLPARTASATALRVVLLSALGGLLGKGLTGQLDPALAAPLLGGALPTAWWGGELAAQLNPRRLPWASLTGALTATGALWVIAVPDLARRVRPGHLYLTAALAAALVPLWLLARRRWGLAVRGAHLRPFRAVGRDQDRLEPILPEELRRMVLEGPAPQIIDVREPHEAAGGWIPGAVNIPFRQFDAWLDAADPRDGAVIVCQTGAVSAQASAAAARRGHRTRYLEKGMAAWEGPLAAPGREGPVPDPVDLVAKEMEMHEMGLHSE